MVFLRPCLQIHVRVFNRCIAQTAGLIPSKTKYIIINTAICFILFNPPFPHISYGTHLTLHPNTNITEQHNHAGIYNCIGKLLTFMTLRTTLAKLVLEFDVGFATDEDGRAFKEEARTQFTTRPGPLRLRFCRRGIELGETWLVGWRWSL